MNFITYIKEAVSPGGTPKRYLVWVSIILSLQALASIVPSASFFEAPFNIAHLILISTIVIAVAVHVLRGEKQRIIAAYCLYIVGLILSTVTISMGITSLSGIVFMVTWSMTLFVSERREYISFDLVVLFLVLMLISSVVLLMFEPAMKVNNNSIILITGAVLTAINIYLVYTDFGYEKNYYQESRRKYADLEILSTKLSDILSTQGKLESLLWQVTQECVPLLDIEDCVIYSYNEKKGCLVQVAACGKKNSQDNKIIDPLEIKIGEGVVGKCFAEKKPIVVKEMLNFPGYIVDDEPRNSELAVPIISNGKVIGVIDSEHRMSGFFKESHLQAFQIMASFCGIKIVEYNARESIEQVRVAKEEAEKYRELDELKSKFITNISHDLKTPLSLIKAPAMRIAEITTDQQVKNHSNYILKNADHLLRVVNQLLQLNRVDKGLNELYIEKLEISSLFEKIVSQYWGLAEKDRIEFTFSCEPVITMTDSFRLEQIIHNLLHNAFRYTGRNGKIHMGCSRLADKMVIAVADNGPGISPEIQSRVFDRFYKADVNNHEGTGIGLSLVKEYAESLDGKVSLESTEGKGTTFKVILPVILPDEPGSADTIWTEAEIGDKAKPVMLVVEDHSDLNDFICTYFQNDFRCIAAFDGEEALLKMKEQTPDIIISDLMMPKMDGAAFVSKVKSNDQFGHIPVIILSAKSQTESKIDLYTIGADNFIVKPFDVAELKAVVNNVLVQRKKLKDLFRTNFLTKDKPVESAVAAMNETPDESQELLNSAIAIVRRNLDNAGLDIKSIAEELGIGRNRFQKEIKNLTQLTPVEFVRSIRLNEAKKMLGDRKLTISEVAYSVGFNNLSYFTRSFKNEFGVLPSEWQDSV